MEPKHKHRTIIFYKDYFQEFFISQPNKIRNKIIWTFDLVEDLLIVPETYLKHVEDNYGLYEIRVQFGNNIIRIFCFFHQGKLIVLANAFYKKTQKIPQKEITKALKIKEEYEKEKKQRNDS